MSFLISAATGNFTAAATWKVADTTMFLDSYAGSTATTTSYVASTAAMPGAITIDGFGINVVSRVASPVGTLSVELYNSTLAASVQIVTVNVSDLSVEGGWHMFSFAPILLLAATNYTIRVKSSIASEVTVLRNATAGNWSRVLRTTTTAAPAAGDNLAVAGQLTGVGASTSYTVTMDNTNATIFGTVSATVPSVTVNNYGSLVWGTAASTNYRLRIAGMMWCNGGSTHTIGTSGTPMPITSTASLEFVNVANVDSGLEVHRNATFTTYGTLLRTVNRCVLNADAAVAATTLTTDVATGWKAGDVIGIASTTRTFAQLEEFTLGVDAVGTTVTLPSGLAYAHSGTVGRQAEIVNVTRNIKITGTSATLSAYVWAKDGSIVNCDQTEFTLLGSATAGKRGIQCDNMVAFGALPVFTDCSMHDYNSAVSQAIGVYLGKIGAGAIARRCDFMNSGWMGVYMQYIPVAAGTLIDDCWFIGAIGQASSTGIYFNAGASATNNRIAGYAASFGVTSTTAVTFGTVSGNTVHSCGAGPNFTAVANSSATGWTIWRTNAMGVTLLNCNNFDVDVIESVGNTSASITMNGNRRCRVKLASAKGEAGYTQVFSIHIPGNNPDSVVYDSVFGAASAPGAATSGDIVTAGVGADLSFQNTQFLSPTEFSISTYGIGIGYRSEKHQGVAGSNKYVRFEGTMARDTTIYDTGGTSSLRVTPTQAATKIQTEPSWTTSVLSGATVTPSVRIRKSVVGDGTAYNGNQPRLMLRANPVGGIASDTVIATCAGAAGSWETVTGVTPAAAENTRFEFYVDCDGTTGWINVDNMTMAADNTSEFDIWANGTPYVIGALALTNFTDIDPAKVEDTYQWKYNSSVNNRTGTRVQPTVGTVQIGVTYGPSSSLTGTYDGSDRWTDPGVANVRLGTAYKANSTTNNRTGNVTEPATGTVEVGTTYGTSLSLTGTYDGSNRWTDPGDSNVRYGVTYDANAVAKTGRVVVPVAGRVHIGDTFETDSATTGTYDGSDRWTDPGDANVRDGVTYKANSATINKTGRVVSPATNTVLAGVGYDTDSATTGTMSSPSAATIASAVWSSVIEGAITAEQLMRINASILNGKVTGAGTGTEVFRDLGDTKDRVIVTTDTAGNRTAIVRDGT